MGHSDEPAHIVPEITITHFLDYFFDSNYMKICPAIRMFTCFNFRTHA